MIFGEDNTCQKCLYPGDGKCSECYGTGKVADITEAFARALGDVSQDCEECDGSGKCSTCNGKGYV